MRYGPGSNAWMKAGGVGVAGQPRHRIMVVRSRVRVGIMGVAIVRGISIIIAGTTAELPYVQHGEQPRNVQDDLPLNLLGAAGVLVP